MIQLTPTVRNLLILNIAIYFIVGLMFPEDGMNILGLHNFQSELFQPYQLFTHMFMHSSDNLMHIITNMIGLAVFGPMIEYYLGQQRFLVLYLVAGIGAGTLFNAINTYETRDLPIHIVEVEDQNKSNRKIIKKQRELLDLQRNQIQLFSENPNLDSYQALQTAFKGKLEFNSDSLTLDSAQTAEITTAATTLHTQYEYAHKSDKQEAKQITYYLNSLYSYLNSPMVGASGAIFGLLLTFGLMFPNMIFRLIIPPISVKAKYLVTFYTLFELYRIYQNNPTDNVAHLAHLGGMLFALILIKLIWRIPRKH